MEYKSTRDLSGPLMFGALWDSARGVKVIDAFPEKIPFGVEDIARNIVMTQEMFGSEENLKKEQKTSLFSLAIGKFNLLARVLFERREKVYIFVLLLPDYFSESQAAQFDGTLQDIVKEFRMAGEKPGQIIGRFMPQIEHIFKLEQNIHDAEILIEPGYDLPTATQEFQHGLSEFKSGNFTRAYYLLRRSGVFFETSGQKEMEMETLIILGGILVEQRKFQTAQQYFIRLGNLAEELQAQKYQERGFFMAGYCAYQRGQYFEAKVLFQKLERFALTFVSRIKFHYYLGQSLAQVEHHESAIQHFLQVLEQHDNTEKVTDVQKIYAQSLNALGLEYYQLVVQELRQGAPKKENFQTYLAKVIDYFKSAAEVWQKLGDFAQVIQILGMLANVHGILGSNVLFLEYNEKALDLCEKSNNLPEKFRIFQRIVQKKAELGMHMDLVQNIDRFLGNIGTHAYVDLVTIGQLHLQLGSSLVQLDKLQEALSEFLIALNIFRRTGDLLKEQSLVLHALINVCHKRGEQDAEVYYADSLKDVIARIAQVPHISRRAVGGVNGIVKEIWIYTKTGIEIFSYATESQLDGELLGGFLLAFQNFSKEVTSQQLRAMAIGPNYYAIHSDPANNFFIMGRANVNCNSEEVECALQTISKKFLFFYEKELSKFDGNKGPFLEFASEMEKIFV